MHMHVPLFLFVFGASIYAHRFWSVFVGYTFLFFFNFMPAVKKLINLIILKIF